jgi:hypothetical protein
VSCQTFFTIWGDGSLPESDLDDRSRSLRYISHSLAIAGSSKCIKLQISSPIGAFLSEQHNCFCSLQEISNRNPVVFRDCAIGYDTCARQKRFSMTFARRTTFKTLPSTHSEIELNTNWTARWESHGWMRLFKIVHIKNRQEMSHNRGLFETQHLIRNNQLISRQRTYFETALLNHLYRTSASPRG